MGGAWRPKRAWVGSRRRDRAVVASTNLNQAKPKPKAPPGRTGRPRLIETKTRAGNRRGFNKTGSVDAVGIPCGSSKMSAAWSAARTGKSPRTWSLPVDQAKARRRVFIGKTTGAIARQPSAGPSRSPVRTKNATAGRVIARGALTLGGLLRRRGSDAQWWSQTKRHRFSPVLGHDGSRKDGRNLQGRLQRPTADMTLPHGTGIGRHQPTVGGFDSTPERRLAIAAKAVGTCKLGQRIAQPLIMGDTRRPVMFRRRKTIEAGNPPTAIKRLRLQTQYEKRGLQLNLRPDFGCVVLVNHALFPIQRSQNGKTRAFILKRVPTDDYLGGTELSIRFFTRNPGKEAHLRVSPALSTCFAKAGPGIRRVSEQKRQKTTGPTSPASLIPQRTGSRLIDDLS